jgi:outer membrane protein TolC
MKANQAAIAILMTGVLLACVPARAYAQGPRPELFSLRRSLETALANSDEIRAAEAGLRIANQQVREAWSSVLPEVRFSASYTRNFKVPVAFLPAILIDPDADPNELIPVRFGADNAWSAGLVLDQPIFEAQAFIGVSTAGRFREVEVERLRGTSQLVVSQVRQGYFNALVADEDLRRLTESVNRITATLAETRALNRAGLTSSYDVLRFEVQLANQEAQVTRAANTVAETRRLLLVDLGLNPSEPIELLGSFIEIDLDDLSANTPANREMLELAGALGAETKDFEELLKTASVYRTDLRQLRGAVDLDEARLAIQRAEFYPTLSLFSNWSIQAQQNGSLSFFQNSATSTVAGLRVEVPLFTGFARFARVEQAKATVAQTEARLARAERETIEQVQTFYNNVIESRQRANSQRVAVGQAQRGFEIATAEYRAGVGSQLQVTDADLALRTSEFNYAQAVFDYLTARSLLDLALGTAPADLGDVGQPLGDRQ